MGFSANVRGGKPPAQRLLQRCHTTRLWGDDWGTLHMRFAIYFTPSADDPLTRAAALWLGRDAFTGEPVGQAYATGDHARLTAAPRRYGFHATMKAPFALAPGESREALTLALQQFCSEQPAVEVPEMRLDRLGSFFALVPARRCPPLDALAAAVTAEFDRFRAPMDAAELERRSSPELTEAQREHLQRWGYPYVFEQFRFHMTLTDRVPEAERPNVTRLLEGHFGPLLSAPLIIDRLALFAEPAPGEPFHVHSTYELGGR